jgi:hypothetical protein
MTVIAIRDRLLISAFWGGPEAQSLAPYQSPTFRAIVVASPHQPKVDGETRTINLKIFDDEGNQVPLPAKEANDPVEACKVYRRLVSRVSGR